MRFLALIALTALIGCGSLSAPIPDPAPTPAGTEPSDPSASDPSSPSSPGDDPTPSPSDPGTQEPSPTTPGAPSPSGGCTSVTATPNVMEQEAVFDTDAEWLDVNDARASDGESASVNFEFTDYSSNLYARDFGFALPANAKVNGIVLEIKRKAAGSEVKDHIMYLADLGAPGAGPKGMAVLTQYTGDKAKTGYWPTSGYSTTTYGSAKDTWGATLDAAKLNASSFGVMLAIKNDGASTTARVDVMKLTVHYCY